MGYPMGQFCTVRSGLPAQKNRAFPDFFDEKMHKSGARGRFA